MNERYLKKSGDKVVWFGMILEGMKPKKYVFTGKTKEFKGLTLHQIKAACSFRNVKEGDIGGWIEKQSNLSHEGDCWVYDNAMVYGNARVFGDAIVSGSAVVFDNAYVYGNAKVFEYAKVYGDARVGGNAHVFGDSMVFGNTNVSDMIVNEEDEEEEEEDTNDIMSLKLPDTISEVVHNGKRYKKEIKWVEVK